MKATRQAFGETLARLGESHQEIVVLDADLFEVDEIGGLFAKKNSRSVFLKWESQKPT